MQDETRLINGDYGELWIEGEWQTSVNAVTADGEISYTGVKLSGSRITHHKATGVEFKGTLNGFKVTSRMVKEHEWASEHKGVPNKYSLVSKLADPEAHGYERIRLINVKFSKVVLANWKNEGQIVTEEIPFNFTGFELIDEIVGG